MVAEFAFSNSEVFWNKKILRLSLWLKENILLLQSKI